MTQWNAQTHPQISFVLCEQSRSNINQSNERTNAHDPKPMFLSWLGVTRIHSIVAFAVKSPMWEMQWAILPNSKMHITIATIVEIQIKTLSVHREIKTRKPFVFIRDICLCKCLNVPQWNYHKMGCVEHVNGCCFEKRSVTEEHRHVLACIVSVRDCCPQ